MSVQAEHAGEHVPCKACGRPMPARRRRARAGSAPRYCSAACRGRRVAPVDRRLEAAILALLSRRAPGATICPSEAARAVTDGKDAWRALMEPARRAARRLAHRGAVEIAQRGRAVDPGTFRGPVRLRLARGAEAARP